MSAKIREPRITLRDLERVMGQKASNISPYVFDPETSSWHRKITFDLKPKRKKKPSP